MDICRAPGGEGITECVAQVQNCDGIRAARCVQDQVHEIWPVQNGHVRNKLSLTNSLSAYFWSWLFIHLKKSTSPSILCMILHRMSGRRLNKLCKHKDASSTCPRWRWQSFVHRSATVEGDRDASRKWHVTPRLNKEMSSLLFAAIWEDTKGMRVQLGIGFHDQTSWKTTFCDQTLTWLDGPAPIHASVSYRLRACSIV